MLGLSYVYVFNCMHFQKIYGFSALNKVFVGTQIIQDNISDISYKQHIYFDKLLQTFE